jgi:hypothetical protein
LVDENFRFRIAKAPGNPHASVDAFKATPACTVINDAVAGQPESAGTVYVSYKLYEGSVWIRYDWENETKRLAFKEYVVAGNFDFGDFEAGKADIPKYGFLA